ncbi:MAG: hypothetical protein ACKO38_03420, partial [Planctomycetota bacterium]
MSVRREQLFAIGMESQGINWAKVLFQFASNLAIFCLINFKEAFSIKAATGNKILSIFVKSAAVNPAWHGFIFSNFVCIIPNNSLGNAVHFVKAGHAVRSTYKKFLIGFFGSIRAFGTL